MSNKKIVSLLAAGTEIVCALGLEDQLVGISHECDFPESIKNRPVCSSINFDPNDSSEAIDRRVKETLTSALSIYNVDQQVIEQLKPEVIITQSQCDVCAVSLSDVEASLSELTKEAVNVLSLQPHTLADIFNDISAVAVELGEKERGIQLLDSLHERIDIVRHKLKFVDRRPKVACVEWIAPLMVAGNWVPELIEIAGGESVLGENGKHSPQISFHTLKLENPEIIIVVPCGFPISRTLQEMNILFDLPGWGDLEAVKSNQVYIVDGNHYFNRSGPRVVDSTEILAEIIHPKQFFFGYEGEGWVKFGL